MSPIADPQSSTQLLEMKKDLDKSVKHYTSLAKRNYAFAYFLAAILVGSSIAGAIGGILFKVSPEILGLAAAVPTIIAFVASVYNPQQRANWHYAKSGKLIALRRKLLFEIPQPPSGDDLRLISESWSTIDEDFSKIWSDRLGLGLTRVIGRAENKS